MTFLLHIYKSRCVHCIFLAVASQARKFIFVVFCSVSQDSEMLLAASAGIFKNAAAEVFQVFEVGSDYYVSS